MLGGIQVGKRQEEEKKVQLSNTLFFAFLSILSSRHLPMVQKPLRSRTIQSRSGCRVDQQHMGDLQRRHKSRIRQVAADIHVRENLKATIDWTEIRNVETHPGPGQTHKRAITLCTDVRTTHLPTVPIRNEIDLFACPAYKSSHDHINLHRLY